MYNLNPLYEFNMPNYAAWKNKPMRDPAREFRQAQIKEKKTGRPMSALDFQQEMLTEGPLGRAIDKKVDDAIDTPIVSNVAKKVLRDSAANILKDIRKGTIKGRFTKKEEKDHPIKTWIKKKGIRVVNALPRKIRHKIARKARDEMIDGI